MGALEGRAPWCVDDDGDDDDYVTGTGGPEWGILGEGRAPWRMGAFVLQNPARMMTTTTMMMMMIDDDDDHDDEDADSTPRAPPW